MLARGLGLEHLRELLQRFARPLVRKGASIAYAGSWENKPENFTDLLLQLINAEREDNSLDGGGASKVIGGLINHAAWPNDLDITPTIEAQWIDCCRIVRVTQELAGIPRTDMVRDLQSAKDSDRYFMNSAITLSRMRQLAMTGMTIAIPQVPIEEVPPIHARIAMGGALEKFIGFIPGILEEALVTLEHSAPLYVLGGFGGAAEVVAKLFLDPQHPPPQLLPAWQEEHTPNLVRIKSVPKTGFPTYIRTTSQLLQVLTDRGKRGLASMNTGLDDDEARQLLTTRDIDHAVALVRKGLQNKLGITIDPFERT
jgi:hypothetical protein